MRLYVIDPDSGDALPVATPSEMAGWKTAAGLAFGADASLHATGTDGQNRPVIYSNGKTGILAKRIVGLATIC